MLKSLKTYWYSSGASASLDETSRVASTAEAEVIITNDNSHSVDQDVQPDANRQNDQSSSSWNMSMSMDSAMLTSVLKPEEVRQTLSKARNFFGKLSSAAIQKTTQILEENAPILSDFSREQNKFEQEKQHQEAIQLQNSVVPWFGYANEDSVKKQILGLSLDKRNFVRNPPGGSQFVFDINELAGAAKLMLTEDPNLSRMRFELVPKAVREDVFWRNYFYRVSLIKQSAQLAELATMKPSSSQARDVGGHVTSRVDGAAPSEDGTTQLSGSSNTSASFEKLNDASHMSGGELDPDDADADANADADIGEGDFVSDSHSLSQTVTLSRDELAQLNLARAASANAAAATNQLANNRRGSKKAEDVANGSDWSPEEFELVADGAATQSGSAQADSDSIDEELEREILAEIALEEAQK